MILVGNSSGCRWPSKKPLHSTQAQFSLLQLVETLKDDFLDHWCVLISWWMWKMPSLAVMWNQVKVVSVTCAPHPFPSWGFPCASCTNLLTERQGQSCSCSAGSVCTRWASRMPTSCVQTLVGVGFCQIFKQGMNESLNGLCDSNK